ncbi:hypothetical protein BKA62DRAFT_786352 [Auriculariales sp. MPI-PUGE-AT-0066]|nr:hypothetical protein BKA62DRAFT_786352 [Auriculariales sp. MPI-PUGE-AT-0066]
MRSTWDSPAWCSLGSWTSTIGNLTFCLFYDTFNVLHNKIAGKKLTMGVISLCSMNLPYDLSRNPGNRCVLTFTPAGFEPSVDNISNLLDPIMDELAPAFELRSVRSRKYPQGRDIRCAVIPVIADSLASNKALGYGSHSCTYHCSFCLCTLDELERLDIDQWMPRTSDAVASAAAAYDAAKTLEARRILLRDSGVRNSPLHRLSYRDHVNHTVLGVMHNIMEGVLQHHARVKLGMTVSGSAAQSSNEDEPQPAVAAPSGTLRHETPMDIDENAEAQREATHLQLELQNIAGGSQELGPRLRCTNTSILSLSSLSGSDDSEYLPDSDAQMESTDSGDEVDAMPAIRPGLRRNPRQPVTPTFDKGDMEVIRSAIRSIIHPTWFELPPSNLGEKSHGKLKAIVWFNLMAKVLPLVLVQHWKSRPTARNCLLLDNFHHLIAATNIVCAFSTSDAAADRYVAHFTEYRRGLQKLWPESASVPNHHYAMHNGEQLNELPFERDIGLAQNISTNFHHSDMDFTILTKTCKEARLMAKIEIDTDLQLDDGSGRHC